jgi:hypothetical protein
VFVKHRLGVAALIAGVVWAYALAGSAAAKEPRAVKDFPLWGGLPSKHFARLGEGTTRYLRWGIYAYRNDRTARRPCVAEVTLTFEGGLSGSEECGIVESVEDPVYTEARTWSNGVGASAFSVLVPLTAPRVRLSFTKGKPQTLATRVLSPRQSKKARVAPFRYLALGVARSTCVNRVTGLSGSGVELFTLEREC